jgi:hypothetical protein
LRKCKSAEQEQVSRFSEACFVFLDQGARDHWPTDPEGTAPSSVAGPSSFDGASSGENFVEPCCSSATCLPMGLKAGAK